MPSERLVVTARDGLSLLVHRVRPASSPRAAVMLLHGLAANRHAFHFPGRSLAQWLADRGYDCFVPELRGHGQSARPAGGWCLDDYLTSDLPAVIDAVREASGRERIHWIGHSMGGILLFCYGILHPDAPLTSGQAVGSALDYSIGTTAFRALLRLRGAIERLDSIPYGRLMHLLAPLLGPHPRSPSAFSVWPGNIEPEMCRRLHAVAFESIPVPLLLGLSATFEPRGLCTRDGAMHYLEHTDRFRVPLRLVAGSRDAQVSVEAVVHTGTRLRAAEVRIHGRAYGDADDYGHWDLIVGRKAPQEVWPGIEAWLARNDDSER